MNQKQFKLISFLLGCALLCIATLQIVWVKTLVDNSKKEIYRQFSEALTNTSSELQRLEDTKRVRINLMDDLNANQFKNQINNISVSSTTRKNGAGSNGRDTSFTIIQVDSTSSKGKKIVIKKVQNYGGGDYTDSVFTKVTVSDNTKIKGRLQNMDSLIKKLVVDFEKKDIDIRERVNAQQITEVLTKELLKKGLDIPYEFSVFYSKNTPLINSKGYVANESNPIMPLFMQDVYRKKSFISAYPTNLGSYIWGSLKIQIGLTILFSLLILIIFIITFKAILKQKKISEIKNDFINNMTHELKTPIATISLVIDAMKNPIVKNNSAQFDTYMTILKEENDRLNSHVESVLQIALLDKSKLELNKTEIDIVTLLKSCIDSFKLKIENKEADITMSGIGSVSISGDGFHIANVFSNLLDNALKYSNIKCRVYIDIKESEGYVVISFKDNGIGMDKEAQKKVFDKFYRSESGNIHTTKGFGLGLSYVKSIIESHNGIIELNSEKNKGSEFIVKLKK